MQIFYIGKEKKIMKIGESQESAQFYRFDKVEKYIDSFAAGDVIETDSFKFEKKQDGKWTNNYITFIKKADGTSTQQSMTSAPSTYSGVSQPTSYTPPVNAVQASIERQCAVKVAAEVLKTFQGQLSPEQAPVVFETYFKVALELIKG